MIDTSISFMREMDWREDIEHSNLDLQYGDRVWTLHNEEGDELSVVYLYQESEYECVECMHKPGRCEHIQFVSTHRIR